MASLASHSLRVDSGNGPPVASMAAPPTRPGSNSKVAPDALPTTWRTFRASGVTAWPIPSPPSTAILYVGMISPVGVSLVGVSGRLLGYERPLAAVRPERPRRTAQDVGREQEEQEPLRMRGHDQHREDDEQQYAGRAPTREVDLLEAVVAKGRDHQDRDDVRPGRDGRPLPLLQLVVAEQQHHRRDDARCGRNGQAYEVTPIAHAGVDVEAGEAESAAGHEQERAQPRGTPEAPERKAVEHEGGRHAEGHDIRERVELHPELRRGLGEPRHLPIQRVEHHRHEDRHRRLGVSSVRGEHDREESADQIARRQGTGEQKDHAARLLAKLLPPSPANPSPAVTAHVPSSHVVSHLSSAMIVSPPRTRSPIATFTSVPRGAIKSVRDPKRMSPKRSPASSLSPTFARQTIRRASTPAICRTTTRAASPSSDTVQ